MKTPTRSTLVISIGIVALLIACKKRTNEPKENPSPNTPAANPAPPKDNWLTHGPSGTKFMSPTGWEERRGPSWVSFWAPDRSAVIAMDSYDSEKDPSKTIMDVARVLELGELDWKGGTKDIVLGNVPGRTAGGTCKVKGEEANYSYATLTPGGQKKILILYAVKQAAPMERKQEAQRSFQSFQRI